MKSLKPFLSVLMILALLLTACGSASPDATVNGFLKACVALDIEKMNEYCPSIATDPIPVEENAYADYFKKLKYEVGDFLTTDTTAVVSVTITAIDLKTIMGSIIADLFGQALTHIGDESFDSDAYANELLAKEINAEDAPTVTNTVNVNLEKNDSGKWIISEESENPEFFDAICGGILSLDGLDSILD